MLLKQMQSATPACFYARARIQLGSQGAMQHAFLSASALLYAGPGHLLIKNPDSVLAVTSKNINNFIIFYSGNQAGTFISH